MVRWSRRPALDDSRYRATPTLPGSSRPKEGRPVRSAWAPSLGSAGMDTPPDAVPGAASGPAPAWDPQRYLRFAGERARPAADLVARIGARAPRTVVDVGCGT